MTLNVSYQAVLPHYDKAKFMTASLGQSHLRRRNRSRHAQEIGPVILTSFFLNRNQVSYLPANEGNKNITVYNPSAHRKYVEAKQESATIKFDN